MMPSISDHTSIAQAKTALRSQALKQRSSIAASRRAAAALAFTDHGVALIKSLAGKTVGGYHPIGEEADCLDLLSALEAKGYIIALPVVIDRNKPLVFREWKCGSALDEAGYGLHIPPASAPVCVPGILLVPLLAFDAKGFRLGYGGGYYDRTLQALRAKSPVTAIGIAFDDQEVDAVPHDKTDEPLDWILTETGVRKIAGGK